MVELTEEQKRRRAILVSDRGQLKTRITKLTNYMRNSEVYANEAHIDRHLKKIDEELAKLANIEIELTASEPTGNHAEESENIMFDYEDMMVLVRKFRDPHRGAEIANHAPATSRMVSAQSCAPTDYLSSLPKAKVKKFDGSSEKWRLYRDWFRITIHEREGLNDYQRVDFLKRTLTGEAEKTINAFQTTSDNYAVAWRLLESTYDNEYILLFRHYQLLLSTPAMKKSSAEEIRVLINHVQTQIYAMKAMGENIDGWNTMLSYLILSKLDKETEREWNRTARTTKVPKHENILNFLREQATRLTCVRPSGGSQNSDSTSISQAKPKNAGNRSQGQTSGRVQALLTSAESKICPICKEQHTIDSCQKFLALNISERIQIAQKLRLCLNCFKNNHKTRVCRASTCTVCQKRHNSLLHLTEADRSATRHRRHD